ncbi:hypothetical protein TorRG33x02_042990 [Trema orientale]|uniref:Uncharacterized protein n=1 Tax=Trema orientale TaxID=63057 RepID=A0A2P5FQ03_TREOI|nr:hypothetical protein TorRG33x02_042990 [Trema orientale]
MDDEFAHVEDEFPIPPWSLLVPTVNGEAKVIYIPTDVHIQNVDVPSHLKQVSIVTAKKLQRMIRGMQQLLIEHLTNTTDTLRNYVATIHNLRNQLGSEEKREFVWADIVDLERIFETPYSRQLSEEKRGWGRGVCDGIGGGDGIAVVGTGGGGSDCNGWGR